MLEESFLSDSHEDATYFKGVEAEQTPTPYPVIPADKQEKLDTFIAQLDPYQWRYLQLKLSSRTFQFDIVGNLPLELTSKLFTNLPAYKPFQCQRVSKRWRRILSSPAVLDAGLNQWYSANDPPLADPSNLQLEEDVEEASQGKAMDSASTSASSASGTLHTSDGHSTLPPYCKETIPHQHDPISCKDPRRVKLEHLQRFRWCKPASSATYVAGQPNLEQHIQQTQYCNGRLAWLKGKSAAIRDLRTGEVKEFVGAGREQLEQLCLTEELVAFSTYSGVCYIHDIATTSYNSLRLASALSISTMGGRGRTIGCVTSEDGQNNRVTLHHFDENQTYDVLLPGTQGLAVAQHGLRFPKDLLVLVALDRVGTATPAPHDETDVPELKLHIMSYALAGRTVRAVGSKTLTLWNKLPLSLLETMSNSDRPSVSWLDYSIRTTDYDGSFRVLICNGFPKGSRGAPFNVWTVFVDTSGRPTLLQEGEACRGPGLHWKGIEYEVERHPLTGSCIGKQGGQFWRHGSIEYPRVQLFGDENFVVEVVQGFQTAVYCFDPHIQLPPSFPSGDTIQHIRRLHQGDRYP